MPGPGSKVPSKWPSLPQGGKVALVGEAPGFDEEQRGEPFVGASGWLLNACLTSAGLLRDEVFIGNVCPWRPPSNKIELWTSGGASNADWWRIEQGTQEVLAELARLRPNVIVALGGTALRALTGLQGIQKHRGSLYSLVLPEGWQCKVLPALHPAAILRDFPMRATLLRDLTLANAESKTPVLTLPERALYTEPLSLDVTMHWLDKVAAAERLFFDIENFMDGYVTVMGFAVSPWEAYSIPFWGPNGPWWSEHDEALIWQRISSIFVNDAEKGAQYGVHDRYVLARNYGIAVKNFKHDTQVCAKILDPELPGSAAFLASMHTREPHWKDEGKSHDAPRDWPKYYRYNGKDCAVMYEVMLSQIDQLRKWGLTETFEATMRSLDPLLIMTLRGVRIDADVRSRLKEQFEQSMHVCRELAEGVLGGLVNPSSPDQLKELLYVRLKYPVVKKRRKDGSFGPTADAVAIAKCALKTPDPVLTILRGYKHYEALRRHVAFTLSPDGRARCQFNPNVETGRLSSSMLYDDTGYNLQNVPRRKSPEVRAQFIADPGKLLGSLDLQKAEAAVVAWLTGDTELIKAYTSGADTHRLGAARIFRRTPEQVTSEQREHGKVFKHAGHYDVGPQTMWEELLEAGEHFELGYIRSILQSVKSDPFIREWHAWTRRQISGGMRTLTNPFGRVRQFLGRQGGEDNNTFREALAYIPQSTVADVLCRAITRVALELEDRVELLLQVHDELVVQVPEKGAEDTMREVAKRMEVPMLVTGIDGQKRPLTIPVSWKLGRSWKECH